MRVPNCARRELVTCLTQDPECLDLGKPSVSAGDVKMKDCTHMAGAHILLLLDVVVHYF